MSARVKPTKKRAARAVAMLKRLTYSPARLDAIRTAFGVLLVLKIFTTWRFVERSGKRSKVPTHPAGTTGVTWAEALGAFNANPTLAGIGVKLGRVADANRIVLFGVDYDGAAKGPLPDPWPATATYTERTPSGGDRFHIIGKYEGDPLEGRRAGPVEIYTEGRFFTLTGDRIKGAAILDTDPRPFYAAIGVPDPRPYGAGAVSDVTGAPIADADLTPLEREYLEAVRGIADDDESKRDFAVCAKVIEMGATDEEAARVLCAGFWRAKLSRKDYVGRTIAKARAAAVTPETIKAFRAASRSIGEGGADSGNPPPIFTIEEALASLVFVSDGSQVVPREDPRLSWNWGDFENMTAASVRHTAEKGRPASIAKMWLRHPLRETVHARTFKAGDGLFCRSPDDVRAINTWRPPPRTPPPADWRARAKPFFDHVAFLVPVAADRELFLDWLAHAEQRPGVLPHVHFLMFTLTQGVGRNLLTAWLARVWPGVTALDVDLAALLDGGFNGRLSRKILAVVNEIREGGGGGAVTHRRAEQMKRFFTDAQRHINPKYGREYVEFNSARWLMFSNHENALPLDAGDRRVYVIENPARPRGAVYYTALYALADDAAFIASVREALRVRNISKFNPGMVAPLTEAKQKIIDASMSDAEVEMLDTIKNYPADCLTTGMLCARLYGTEVSAKDRSTLRYIASRAGARRYPSKVRLIEGGPQNPVWVLRNHARWLTSASTAIEKEINRGVEKEKSEKVRPDAGSTTTTKKMRRKVKRGQAR